MFATSFIPGRVRAVIFHRHSSDSEELATRVRFETIGRNGKPGWHGFDTKLLLSVPDGPDADDAFDGSDPPLGTGKHHSPN